MQTISVYVLLRVSVYKYACSTLAIVLQLIIRTVSFNVTIVRC